MFPIKMTELVARYRCRTAGETVSFGSDANVSGVSCGAVSYGQASSGSYCDNGSAALFRQNKSMQCGNSAL